MLRVISSPLRSTRLPSIIPSIPTLARTPLILTADTMGHPKRRGGARGGNRNQTTDTTKHRRPANAGRHNQGQNQAPSPSHAVPFRVATPPLTEAVPEDSPRFADLLTSGSTVHPTLVHTITQDLKFDHMMPVQSATLGELLPPNRSDCLVQAKTGTGKTIAFLLPAIQTLIEKKPPPGTNSRGAGISILVMTPTRELALQIGKEARALLQRLPQYRVCEAIGGTNKNKENRAILAGCDVLIATPGRLLDHMDTPEIMERFRNVDTLVLDEADRLLDMGFYNDLKSIVEKIPQKADGSRRQGMLFSATIAPHVEKVAGLVCSPGYKFISTIPAGEVNTHERVPQMLVTVPSFGDVVPAMVGSVREEMALVGAPAFKSIIFAPTAALADFYGHILDNIPGLPPVSVLHSRMSQNRRTKTTDAYRTSASGILVATDVVARGMDFPGVTTVFQVGLPADKESYIHRLGRTARANKEGRGIFIVSEAEAWFPKYQLKDISFIQHTAQLESGDQVKAIAGKMEESQVAKTYQAWMGYYKNHMKAMRWDAEMLVAVANEYAKEALQSPVTPPIEKGTASKMGLRGVKGLYIVPNRPRENANRGRGSAKAEA